MSKTVEELASALTAKFGRMEPDGDGWGWDWVADPLAVEAAKTLREMQSVLIEVAGVAGYLP